MELTPKQIKDASFPAVRKGYDPEEVDAFLAHAAGALEAAQQQSAAMEARARAAVARLQEVTSAESGSGAAMTRVGPNEAETISRTLVLAQRTADTTIAEARAEADRLVGSARAEARKVTQEEHQKAIQEVENLRSRREGLLDEIDYIEQFLIDQRDRIRSAAREIDSLAERVPTGHAAQLRGADSGASARRPAETPAESTELAPPAPTPHAPATEASPTAAVPEPEAHRTPIDEQSFADYRETSERDRTPRADQSTGADGGVLIHLGDGKLPTPDLPAPAVQPPVFNGSWNSRAN